MITSLLNDARTQVTLWRNSLVTYWQLDARDHLPFYAMIGLPAVCVLGIVCFAWLDGTRVEAPPEQAVSHEMLRAQRRENDLQCLAENIYFESRGEPLKGQYAVAEVTLNRTRAAHFPHTVCGVVHEMRWDPARKRPVADFSWTELGALSPDDDLAWKRALTVATETYDDMHDPVVPGALFYHSTSVRPAWARSRKALTTIGNHVFYR